MHYYVGFDRTLMILLMAAYILQGCRCAPEDATAAATDATAAATKDAGTPSATNRLSSALTASKNEAVKCGSEVVTASKEALKAGGRLFLATFGLLMSAWNGVSLSTAKAGNTMANGYRTVNKLTGRLPVVGTVTTGVQNVLSGVTDTFRDNSEFNSARRVKLVNDMRTDLNNFRPDAKTSSTVTDTTTAANAFSPTPAAP